MQPHALAAFGAALLAAPLTSQMRPYTALDLGSPPGQSPMAGVGAEGMSPNGDHVAGYSVWEPFIWDRGSGMRALQKGPGDQLAQVNDVNDAGIGVGGSGTLLGGSRASVWDLAGSIRSLHQTSWYSSYGIGITNAGIVVVGAFVRVGTVNYERAFYGPLAGPLVDLAPAAGVVTAHDVNQLGQVCLAVDGAPKRYTPGIGLEDVGPFEPERINDHGQMAGRDEATGNVVRYTDGIGWQPLGTAPVGGFRAVGGIDGFGRVVATEYVRTGISPPSYTRYGHLFVDGLGRRKLDDLVDASLQVRVDEVSGITDDGKIACWGSIGSNNRALLLEPRFVSVYGGGCAGGGGRQPKAFADGMPARGQRLVLLGAGAVPNGIGLFVLSFRQAAVALPGGCTVLADPAAGVALAVAAGAAGQAHLPIDLPATTPAGAVFAQFATLDAGAANGLFALSNGVRIAVQ